VLPLARVERVVCRSDNGAGDSEERSKGAQWGKAPVEPENVLVEVSLEVLTTDAVVNASDPGFQIGEHQMDHWKVQIHLVGLASDRFGVMLVARPFEIVALPPVGEDDSTGLDGSPHKIAKSLLAAVSDRKTNPAGVTTASPLLRTWLLAPSDLDGSDNRDLVVDPAPLPSGSAADLGFVNLDVFKGEIPTDAVLVWAYHAGAKLVEDEEGCFVAGDIKLALELPRGHPRRLAGNQVGGPEPGAQWRVTVFHHRPNPQPGFFPAFPANQHLWAGRQSERLSYGLAP